MKGAQDKVKYKIRGTLFALTNICTNFYVNMLKKRIKLMTSGTSGGVMVSMLD